MAYQASAARYRQKLRSFTLVLSVVKLSAVSLSALMCTYAYSEANTAQTNPQYALSTPLPSANRNPLVLVHSIPQPTGAYLAPAQTGQWGLALEMASLSSQNLTAAESADYAATSSPLGESILLDGETIRGELSYRFGINQHSDITINLPYIAHTSGFTDSGIEKWHDWFDLPNSNRGLRPRDALLYSYSINGEEQLRIDRDQQGTGDIQLDYRYSLKPQTDDKTTADNSAIHHLLQVSLKLATGDRKRLTGSGSNSLAISLNTAQASVPGIRQLSWHANSGAMWLDNGGILADLKKQWLFFGSAGIGWQLNNQYALRLQFNGHSAIYNSDTKELGKTSGQIVIGLNAKTGKQTLVQLYFTEDIIVRTSPDIGIGLSIRQFTD